MVLRMDRAAPWTLYYDGGCNLCHTSKLQAEAWAERSGRPLEVDVLVSDAALAKGYGGQEMILEADGKVFRAAEAWLKLMEIAPWYLRWVAFVARLAPIGWLAKKGYEVVARNRIKWFGSRECQIPRR